MSSEIVLVLESCSRRSVSSQRLDVGFGHALLWLTRGSQTFEHEHEHEPEPEHEHEKYRAVRGLARCKLCRESISRLFSPCSPGPQVPGATPEAWCQGVPA